ncbi:MAG: alpha/beta hydrolase [Acidobacteria bacterium]|nr:alpha/beta hydrolase [Acidobacteriota bacterium]
MRSSSKSLASAAGVPAVVLCLASLLSPVAAQTPPQSQSPAGNNAAARQPGVEGDWLGALDVGGGNRLRLVLHVKRQGGKLTGSLDSPDQGANDLALADVAFSARTLRFTFPNPDAPGSYEGVMSADGARIEGYWSQGGGRPPLSFARANGAPAQALTPQAVTRGRLQFRACEKPALRNGLCAKYEVFEDRAAMRGRKIALSVVLLPALAEKPAPDAVFYFMGGPGAAASSAVNAPLLTKFRRTRDVVLVDQRGTGDSNQLRCDVYGDPADMRGYFGETFPEARIRACRTELEKIADLRLYTTPIAMADLDEIRAAMGYDKINVSGGSYGSTAALAYLRLYPQHVRAAVVSGVAPVDYKMALPFARGVEHALDRLFTDCAADPKCDAAYPALRKEFSDVVARLAKEPATFAAMNPATHRSQQITMTREAFMEHIRAALYVPDMMVYLPFFIHEMASGNYSHFAAASFGVFKQLDSLLARGMHLSVVCAESVPYFNEEEIKRETADTFYGDARVRAYQRACGLWAKGDVPAALRDTSRLDTPVLMISGDIDPVTPPFVGASALAQYTQGKQVVVRNGTHAPYECTDRLMAEFVERGTWQGLDTSCVDQVQRLPFFVPPPATAGAPPE